MARKSLKKAKKLKSTKTLLKYPFENPIISG